MKRIFTIVLTLCVLFVVFLIPVSAESSVSDGSPASVGNSLFGVGTGYFDPLDCFTLIRRFSDHTGADSRFAGVSTIGSSTIGNDPEYKYLWFSNSPVIFPNVVAVLGDSNPYSYNSYLKVFKLSLNSFAKSMMTSVSLIDLGERIDFEMPIFIRRSDGTNNSLLQTKLLKCTFRPYDGVKYYTNSDFPEIQADVSFSYIGQVNGAPYYDYEIFREGSGVGYNTCNYDHYVIKISFEYSYDLVSDRVLSACPQYALYDMYCQFGWNAPQTTADYFTGIVLGRMTYSRFKGGYPVDFYGDIDFSGGLPATLDQMNNLVNSSYNDIAFAGGWANSMFDGYLIGPVQFFGKFTTQFFSYCPQFANLSYTLIFLAVGIMLFSIFASVVPGLGKGAANATSKASKRASSSFKSYHKKN